MSAMLGFLGLLVLGHFGKLAGTADAALNDLDAGIGWQDRLRV
jgi:hypothetical protein